jgi:hypothetical protein
VLFDRKNCRPPQVYAVANAIIQGAKLEATSTEERQKLLMVDNQLQISPPNLEQHNSDLFTGNVIFSDAAWRVESHRATGKTGIGVVIQHSRISHIHRSRNVKAHHQARLALKIQSTTVAIRCLSSGVGQCLSRDILNVSSVYPYTLLSVKCI